MLVTTIKDSKILKHFVSVVKKNSYHYQTFNIADNSAGLKFLTHAGLSSSNYTCIQFKWEKNTLQQ